MNLGDWISDESIDRDQAVGWALRLAKALQLLHRRGLAHGNVCPEAIAIRGGDYDLPASLLPAERVPLAPSFFTAERIAGEPATPADDVWSVGVLLYYALTGAFPFEGTDRVEAAPLTSHGCDDAALQAILDRMFHPSRNERILTAHDLVTVLSRCHLGAEELEPLELPPDTLRSAHRVRHVSRPVIDAVTREVESFPPLPRGASDRPADEADEPLVPQRDSETAFLGWLSSGEPDRRSKPMPEPPLEPAPEPAAQPEPAPAEPEPAPAEPEPAPAARPEPAPVEPEPVSNAQPAAAPKSAAPPEPARAAEPPWPAAAAPRRRKVGWPIQVAIAAAVVLVGYAVIRLTEPSRSDSKPSPSSTSIGAPPTAAQGSASPSSAPKPAHAPAGDRNACLRSLFADDTFVGEDARVASLCEQTQPGKGVLAIKAMVVAAGAKRATTAGMVEWSRLGWYGMAAFTILHARCCDGTVDVKHPRFQVCKLGTAVDGLHRAVRERGDVDEAVRRYDKAVHCAWRSNNAELFLQTTQPTAQQLDYLGRTAKRAKR